MQNAKTAKFLNLLNVSTVKELRAAELPSSWSYISRARYLNSTAPLYSLLDTVNCRTLSEAAYTLLNGPGACKVCSSGTPFKTWKSGRATYCGKACMHKDADLALSQRLKREATMLERYGAKHTLSSANLRAKVEKTSLTKYGITHPASSDASRNKRKKTNTERYGGPSPGASAEISAKYGKTRRANKATNHIATAEQLGFKLISGDPFDREPSTWQCSCGSQFSHSWMTAQHAPICRVCTPMIRGTSKEEQELAEWLRGQLQIETNYRIYTGKKTYSELDVFVPSKKVAIEFNGLYWHSELFGRGSRYHADKMKLAAENGIKLVQVFEHEWSKKKEICKSIISAKLGLIKNKFHARKLELVQLDKAEARAFFDQNHISGNSTFNVAFGLKLNGELLCAGSWAQDRFARDKSKIELIRFTSKINCSISGGLGRITAAAQAFFPGRTLKTFCDLRWGTGDGYTAAGWDRIKETAPAYWYFTGLNVSHRSMYQRKKLLELSGKDSGTEWELAQFCGLNRFWDCGNAVFERAPK